MPDQIALVPALALIGFGKAGSTFASAAGMEEATKMLTAGVIAG